MTGWTAKRFWQAAAVAPCEGGFTVQLDNRPVKTPAKAPLVLPTIALAREVADEWQAQQGAIKPETMPFTRMANSAIDKVVPQFDEVAAMLAEYGGSDLLCYRATAPAALADRQARAWDPLLDWAAQTFGARLCATSGVMHVEQEAAALAALAHQVHALSNFRLAAFHDLVAISGSLVIALAVARGRLDPEVAWDLSRIDETWQTEQWGEDEEAAAAERQRHAAFLHAARFYALCG